jgi:hypothetical protein
MAGLSVTRDDGDWDSACTTERVCQDRGLRGTARRLEAELFQPHLDESTHQVLRHRFVDRKLQGAFGPGVASVLCDFVPVPGSGLQLATGFGAVGPLELIAWITS